MGLIHSPRIITNGLILALNAADRTSYPGSGTVWNDLSGNGNNGVLTNGPTFNSDNGGSIVFSGSPSTPHEIVTVPYNPMLIPNNLTLSVWINRITAVYYSHFVGIPASDSTWNTPYASYGIEYIDTGDTISLVTGYVDNTFNYNTVGTFGNNVWFNFTATYDKSNVKVYINSELRTTRAESRTLYASTANFYIGANSPNGAYPLNGKISNVLLYNRALTDTEIIQNYDATKTRFGL